MHACADLSDLRCWIISSIRNSIKPAAVCSIYHPPPPRRVVSRTDGAAYTEQAREDNRDAGTRRDALGMSELCLHRGRARFTIDLHPSTAGDVLAGIREQLQQLLYKCAPPHPHS